MEKASTFRGDFLAANFVGSNVVRRCIFPCLFGILGVATGVAQSKQPSIRIDNYEITLGMSSDNLLALLRQDYTVAPLPNGDGVVLEWVVSRGKDRLPFGSIYTKSGKVVGVGHLLLDHEMDSAQEIFDALFVASSKLSNEGRNTCEITTWTGYLPDSSLSKATVILTCGAYRISLLRNEFKSSDGKSVAAYLAREELGQTE